MKLKAKGLDIAKSCERQFYHIGSHTILICRFALDSEAHTAVVKKGIHTTFGRFVETVNPIEYRINAKSKKEALENASSYINEKLNVESP